MLHQTVKNRKAVLCGWTGCACVGQMRRDTQRGDWEDPPGWGRIEGRLLCDTHIVVRDQVLAYRALWAQEEKRRRIKLMERAGIAVEAGHTHGA